MPSRPAASGREPSVRTLCRLALIYQCGVADLIDEENYTGPRDAHHAGDEPRCPERPGWRSRAAAG